MNSFGKSDVGKVRAHNEDYIIANDDQGIYLLADGMGGHNAGEVASELAVKTSYAYLKERLVSASDDEIPGIASEAMKAAHEAIKVKASTDLSMVGMGATLVEVVVRGTKVCICHAGDSRAYLCRDALHRLTRDHRLGDYLLENRIVPRELIPERQWHALTQAVGVGSQPVPDIREIDLISGDMLLLCSDGLTDMLSDQEIEVLISGGAFDMEIIAQSLVDAANEKGGWDNISVVLIKK